MASDTATQTDVQTGTALVPWQAGTLGGIVAAIVMGAMMTMQMQGVLENAIPAMYGLEGGLAGWILHVSHGAVLGVVFAAILVAAGRPRVDLATGAGIGLAYGVVVWAALAVVVMPIWLSAVGFGMAPDVPNVNATSLGGHVAYGLVLGAAYAVATE